MRNGLLGSRHHTVVGCDDDDGDIRHLCTASTHGSEGLMTRSIQECDVPSILQLYVVSTDVLGNTTGLAFNHIGVTDVVQQRCLTMVYVSHHGNDGCARQQVVLVVDFFSDSLLNLCTYIFGLEAKLIGNQVDGLGIQPLIDRCHHTDAHQSSNQFVDIHIHHGSQFAYCHEFGKLQCLTFLTFRPCFRTHAFLHGITFFLTVFSTLPVLGTLTGESGQRFFYLACYLFLVHLQGFLVTSSALSIFLISISAVSKRRLIGIATAIVSNLSGSSIDVNPLLVDANPLFASIASFFFTFFATLFLGFLLGSSTLVDGAKVYFTQHIHLRRILQAQLTLGLEEFGTFLLLVTFLRFGALLCLVALLWLVTFL